MAYPCLCIPSSVDPPAACPSGTCLGIPMGITIGASTSVLPCGSVGMVDVASLSDLTNCTGTIAWTLVSYDTTAFSVASINSSGELSFTTTDDAVVGTYYDFVVKGVCTVGILSAFTIVKVPIKNGCYAVSCDTGFHCNPCTGACIANAPDLVLS